MHDIQKAGLLSRTQQTPQNQSPYLSYDGISISDGNQWREQRHGVQCHLMVFRRTAGAGVCRDAHGHATVGGGEHGGEHAAIGGNTTYGNLLGALMASLNSLPHLPKVSRLTTAWPFANSAVSAVRSYIGSSGATKKLRPILEIIDPKRFAAAQAQHIACRPHDRRTP